MTYGRNKGAPCLLTLLSETAAGVYSMRGASNFEGLGEGIYAGVSPPSEDNCLDHNARAPDEDQKGDPDQSLAGDRNLPT